MYYVEIPYCSTDYGIKSIADLLLQCQSVKIDKSMTMGAAYMIVVY
jgi:hypothetical protein